MKIRNHILPALLIGVLAQTARGAPAQDAAPNTDSKAAVPAAKATDTGLKSGMPSETVIKIMGQPAEVKPMKTQEGKAEIWVYRRQVADRVDYVVISTPIISTVPDGRGSTRTVVTGERTDNQEQHHITTDVIEVRMFIDHYVTQKITRTESTRII
jgi:hypothetical protein